MFLLNYLVFLIKTNQRSYRIKQSEFADQPAAGISAYTFLLDQKTGKKPFLKIFF